jgi:hypothetical protein
MDQNLLDFTRRALAAGVERGEVSRVLKQAGWADADIKAAVDSFAEIAFPLPVPKPKPYLSAWEVFIHLVMFTALYVSAYHLGMLIFDFINLAFPDALQNQATRTILNNSIRWNISSLIIGLPLFLFAFWFITKSITDDPSKRNSRPRKWLTYLTLFIAVVTLVGDLVTLVNNALGGELTVRFVMKVLTVAIIAGGVFVYFLTDVRQDEQS